MKRTVIITWRFEAA